MPTDYVCLDALKVGADDLIPGDRIDIDELIKRGAFDQRLVDQLIKSMRVGRLTRETYQVALARRPAGSPWPPVGFTDAFLLAAEVVDKAELPSAPPRPKAEPGKPVAAAAKKIDAVVLTEDKIPVGPHFVQPRKAGNFTTFDVVDGEGKLLRDKGFKHKAQAIAFLEDLYTKPDSTGNAGADPQETDADGRDLQPGDAGSQGPDPAADR